MNLFNRIFGDLKIKNGVLIECKNKNVKIVEIPTGVTSIWRHAFWNCKSLKSIQHKDKQYNVECFDDLILFIDKQQSVNDVTIYEGKNFLNIGDGEIILSDTIYVASNGTLHAHGETIKKANDDLRFKINQEVLAKESITLDTEITVDRYRAISGAGEKGIKDFMSKYNLTEPMTARNILPILEKINAPGLDKFKELIK